MIQVYTGEGKGKTTAALGLALRAAGQGCSVRIIQFMKGNRYTGEIASAYRLGIEIFQCGEKCSCPEEVFSEGSKCSGHPESWNKKGGRSTLDQECFKKGWRLAQETIHEEQHHLLILDEFIYGLNYGWMELEVLLNWLEKLPPEPEVVLTGRNAPVPLQETAHLVSEINKVKHYFDSGIKARQGIEY